MLPLANWLGRHPFKVVSRNASASSILVGNTKKVEEMKTSAIMEVISIFTNNSIV